MTDEFECAFCLAVVEGEDYPDRCERCEMKRCRNCRTWLKERDGKPSKFCYGCGAIQPETESHFCRTSSFACAYMEEAWSKKNLGEGSTGVYAISTGYESVEAKKEGRKAISSWLVKKEDGQYTTIRELTDEEKAIFRASNSDDVVSS